MQTNYPRLLVALLILIPTSVGLLGRGPVEPAEGTPAPEGVQQRLYDEYAGILHQVDERGMVNYRQLKKDRQKLDRFAGRLASLQEAEYTSWTQAEKTAFWINAYNGLTLLAIVDHYPIQSSFLASLRFPKNSIRQISGVWDGLTFTVMGKEMTLDSMEHQVLRKQFSEPRIHMALVCAAKGCPPLRREPYRGDLLEKQLEEQSRRFLSDPNKFRFDPEDGTVYISKIFSWFGKDFVPVYGQTSKFESFSVVEKATLSFAAAHLDRGKKMQLLSGAKRIRHIDYDWSLNEQAND